MVFSSKISEMSYIRCDFTRGCCFLLLFLKFSQALGGYALCSVIRRTQKSRRNLPYPLDFGKYKIPFAVHGDGTTIDVTDGCSKVKTTVSRKRIGQENIMDSCMAVTFFPKISGIAGNLLFSLFLA